MEEFRLKHEGRNVPSPPLPSPNADAWTEEMKEEEEGEVRRVTWVKVEGETQFPSRIIPPWSSHEEAACECSKLWEGKELKMGK